MCDFSSWQLLNLFTISEDFNVKEWKATRFVRHTKEAVWRTTLLSVKDGYFPLKFIVKFVLILLKRSDTDWLSLLKPLYTFGIERKQSSQIYK